MNFCIQPASVFQMMHRDNLCDDHSQHSRQPSWNWSGSLCNKANEPKFGEAITVIDCWNYEDDKDSSFSSTKQIEESQVEEWLHMPPRSQHDQQPLAGLRIIHRGQRESAESPFSPELSQSINQAFRLTSLYFDIPSSLSGACGRFFLEDSTPVFVCQRSSNSWTISTVVRYDIKNNITVGYVYSARGLDINSGLSKIPSQFAANPHPLLVPVLMNEMMAEHLTCKLVDVDRELELIEEKTGFSDFMINDNNEVWDYRSEIQRLGSLTHRFAYDQVRINNVELTNRFLDQQLKSIKEWANFPKSQNAGPILSSAALLERVNFSFSSIQHLKQYQGLSMRLRSRQDVLFNLINQQDSASNIKIAAAAQQDGYAMKITAVLATLFLPATFVSTFMAMPLFDWGAGGWNSVISDKFWIYWVVTVPLTMVIGIVVTRWILMRNRRDKDREIANRFLVKKAIVEKY